MVLSGEVKNEFEETLVQLALTLKRHAQTRKLILREAYAKVSLLKISTSQLYQLG